MQANTSPSGSRFSSILRKLVPECGNPACPSNVLRRALTPHNSGVKIGGDWYCRVECLAQVTKGMIEDLMAAPGKPSKAHSSRVPLGLLLLSRGILTSEQLRVSLDHQRSHELDFGAAVQQLGFATQEQVTAAVAAQWACPVFPLGTRPLEVRMKIPRRFVDLYEMLPVHYAENDRRLMIGFVRSVQHQLLYTIGHITSCTVVPCFVTAREYEVHLNSSASSFDRDCEVVFDQISETEEIARVTTNYLVQLAAGKVRLGKCRDYLWARIWGRKQEIDLLFRVEGD